VAVFRKVYTEFWTDPKVLEEMTPEDKYFLLYLLTNSYTTQIGIYPISKKTIAFELGYSPESVEALMDRFITKHELITYNKETREIAIKNWGKYNLNRGGKPMEDCIKSELSRVKDVDLIPYIAENIENAKIRHLYDTYTKRNTISGQEEDKEEEEEEEEEKDKEQEQEQEYKKSSSSSSDEFKELAQLYQKCGFTVNGMTPEWIEENLKSYGYEWLKNALLEAESRSKRTKKYVDAILNNWNSEGGMTLRREGANNENSQGNNEQHDEYAGLGISL